MTVPMWRRPRHPARPVDALVEACESGLDLPAVMAAVCTAVSESLSGVATAAYVLTDDGANLRLAAGEGADELDAPEPEGPVHIGDRWLVPLISARRTVGCIVTHAPAYADLSGIRLIAVLAAQAIESARLWERAGDSSATQDVLTGLSNHRGFERALSRELARAMRGGVPVAVAMVDLDGFQAANESRGHAAGDELLRTAARCLASGVRTYDNVSRIGPDEFGLVLPGMEPEVARALLERLAAAFASSAQGATVSAGVAGFPADGDTQGELVRLATGALYWARRGGGGRAVAYDSEVVEALSAEERARQLERDTYERTMRALEAARGQSASARAVSEYAGHIAAHVGLSPDRTDRVRLAAFLYDSTTPGGDRDERARVASKVVANALDAEAAEWLLAAHDMNREAPMESRIIAVAAAFVEAGGHLSSAGAGRALADMWQRRDEFDPGCMRALETLLADQAAGV
jgi:diguanylate cyclase (GGDEF)-like protein